MLMTIDCGGRNSYRRHFLHYGCFYLHLLIVSSLIVISFICYSTFFLWNPPRPLILRYHPFPPSLSLQPFRPPPPRQYQPNNSVFAVIDSVTPSRRLSLSPTPPSKQKKKKIALVFVCPPGANHSGPQARFLSLPLSPAVRQVP